VDHLNRRIATLTTILTLLAAGTIILDQTLRRESATAHAAGGHVSINEVEHNPPGADAGNEWIELYNPTGTEVGLEGWTLSRATGKEVTLPPAVVPAGGYLVITIQVQWLADEDEQIVLRDSGGNFVDGTPIQSDGADDERCWARHPDGASTWAFGPPSKGGPNGEPVPEGVACLAATSILTMVVCASRRRI
jgi:hypothetical protein